METKRLKGYWQTTFSKYPYRGNGDNKLGDAHHPDIGEFKWRSAFYDSRTDEWVIVVVKMND